MENNKSKIKNRWISDRTILFADRKPVRFIKMHSKKRITSLFCLCGSSFLLTIIGIIILCTWHLIYEYILTSAMVLKPGSSAYGVWKKNPLPVSLKLYVFNWTNPHDVRNNHIKPRFEQLGPYTFDETKEKTNITWNSNGTVTFKHLKKWYFEPENSAGTLTDPVTSISPVSLSAAYSTRDWNIVFRKMTNIFLPALVNSVEVNTTVGQLLFDGFEDQVLNMANSLPDFSGSGAPKMDKFAWFYGRNGSEDFEGVFNMDTGLEGGLGKLYEWNYVNRTPFYKESCGKVQGSAGELFKRHLKKNDLITFFSPDLCRYVELEFEKEVIINGIIGYKYSAGDRFLDNGTKYVENKCFCEGDCMPSGALNVSACRYGSPAFVSLPHFYKADPYYLNLVEGLIPDTKSHEFYIIFEPNTGLPLEVAARLQLNLLMQPLQDIRLYRDVRKVYFPILWFEQVVRIPDSISIYLKLLLNFEAIFVALGIFLIFLGVLMQICMCYKICNTNLFRENPNQYCREEVPLNKSQG